MARLLRLPEVSANTTEAVLAQWLVGESTDFTATEALATVETEKAAVDIEADVAGRVLKALVPPGAQVEVGDPIAVLGEPGEVVPDMVALLASLGVGAATQHEMPERRDVPATAEPVRTARSSATAPSDGRLFASPLARKLAREAGLQIDDIRGTGPRGRILRRDVDRALASRAGDPEPLGAAGPVGGAVAAYEEIPHSRIRLATARRLTQSKQETPHFYLRASVRAEGLLEVRSEINADGTTKVSLNDLVLKAVASAHRRVPR